MTIDHHENAVAHVQAVKAARHGLRDAYSRQVHDPREVAQLNAELGDALKLAEVEATLYIGDRLDALLRTIQTEQLTRGAVA